MKRAAVALALVVVLVTLAVQAAMSALYGALGVPGSLPARLDGEWPLRLAERTGLDRIGPVRVALARAAVFRGAGADARRLLDGAGSSATVDDLRGRLAMHDGDTAAALRWFASAGDFVAARGIIDALAERDPRAAYEVIRGFDRRIAAGAVTPEVAADLVWREGQIAAAVAYATPAEAARYNRLALDAYRRALAFAPKEETYLLAFGYQSLLLGDAAAARSAYVTAARVVPDSTDAFVGWAASSAALGDCATARRVLAQAGPVRFDAYGPPLREPLARCPP